MALTKIGASLGGGADTIFVTQTGHGLTLGYPVKVSGNGTFAHATADSEANADAVGIIIESTTNTMLIALSGKVTVDGALPGGNVAAGTVLYLPVSAGKLTATEPTGNTEISKPMAVVSYLNSEMILINYRGEVISTAGVTSAPTDAQYVTLATSSGLSAERTLAGGTDITLVDAGANGAATLNHDDNFSGTAAQYTAATVTVNNTGHITAIAAGSAGPSQADATETENQSDVDKYVPPDLLHRHPGIAKATWNGNTNIVPMAEHASYGIDSFTDHGLGDHTFTFDTAFSSINYSWTASLGHIGVEVTGGLTVNQYDVDAVPRTTTALRLYASYGHYTSGPLSGHNFSGVDCNEFDLIVFGDQ